MLRTHRSRGAALLCATAIGLAGCGDSGAGDFDIEGVTELAEDVSGREVSEADSLYVAANLERVLAELRKRVGDQARVDPKIEPAALKVQAQPAEGEAQSVAIGVSGNAFQTPVPGFDVAGPALSEIDPQAVETIARQVAAEAGVPLTGISYFTTLTGGEPIKWGIYLEDGRRWEAGLDGGGVRQVS